MNLGNEFVMYRKRDPELAKLMFSKEWLYNDSIWEERKFKTIIGNTSKTVYVVDSESREMRLIYKITLFKNLSPEQLWDFQYTFNYIYRDQKFHAAIKCNHAQTGGVMKAIGYWAGMESGYDFGIYAMYREISSERLSEHFSHGIQFHNKIGLSFLNMAPAFFRERNNRSRISDYHYLE